jgi:pyruvate kinase
MDVARINSAHDDEAVWSAISANVRRAAALAGRPCKVLFDLSGPKLRTGAVGVGAAVARVKPRRDPRGFVIEPGRVRLGAADPPQRRRPGKPEVAAPTAAPVMPAQPAAARLPVGAGAPVASGVPLVPIQGDSFLKDARVGDVIEVEEPSRRLRRLIVAAISDREILCTCDRSVRLETGRTLRLLREDAAVATAQVARLEERTTPIRISCGDEVLLGDESVAASAPPRDLAGRRDGPIRIPSTLGAALRQVQVGDPIWFDDGRIGGTVVARENACLRIRVEVAPEGGVNLRSDKGINLPGTRLDLPRPTPQDVEDLSFAVRHADMVGFSFVEQPEDVLRLERLLSERGGDHLGIVLKIETRRAFEALPQLLLTGLRSPPLGVMVARGDLAVEVGFARLAEVQEEILWLCEAAHVPVVWATQVLETLAKKGLPTRSEVSDAALGVRAECVMLNKGPFVGDAVRMLDDVLRRMQDHQLKKRPMFRRLSSFGFE